jgi:hypothetical protein
MPLSYKDPGIYIVGQVMYRRTETISGSGPGFRSEHTC